MTLPRNADRLIMWGSVAVAAIALAAFVYAFKDGPWCPVNDRDECEAGAAVFTSHPAEPK